MLSLCEAQADIKIMCGYYLCEDVRKCGMLAPIFYIYKLQAQHTHVRIYAEDGHGAIYRGGVGIKRYAH